MNLRGDASPLRQQNGTACVRTPGAGRFAVTSRVASTRKLYLHATIPREQFVDKTISIAQFISAIRRLPPDEPRSQPGVWYRTQKEHWLGWLGEYHGPGAYGRAPSEERDARFVYNHIVCPEMLLWLIEASGGEPEPRRGSATRCRDWRYADAAVGSHPTVCAMD